MIEVNNVSKSFSRVRALHDVTLRVEPGERVAFVGANGSGKTTLLRALIGLVRVEGQVRIRGVDPARSPEEALRHVAYIPQIAPPLEAPVGEVVRAFCALRGRTYDDVRARVARLGLDLEALRPTRFRDLSGGQKQKLLAAMALATEAPILVCDEPTANLDPVARTAFFEQVHERAGESILILCSHRLDEVRTLVDRVVELRDGRVVRDCPLATHLDSEATFRVEVEIKRAAPELSVFTDELRTLGFRQVGPGRLAAHLGHAEKLAIVGRLVRERGELLQDLTISDGEGAAWMRPWQGSAS
ncbi:MAG: ABC transporter ATP-binding protein [Myxococcota bacterium]